MLQAKIDAQLQHEAGKYLPFPLPQTAIILVQDSRSCQKVWERLQEAPLLGLDVEGCPQLTHTRRPVSLLQVMGQCLHTVQGTACDGNCVS